MPPWEAARVTLRKRIILPPPQDLEQGAQEAKVCAQSMGHGCVLQE